MLYYLKKIDFYEYLIYSTVFINDYNEVFKAVQQTSDTLNAHIFTPVQMFCASDECNE